MNVLQADGKYTPVYYSARRNKWIASRMAGDSLTYFVPSLLEHR